MDLYKRGSSSTSKQVVVGQGRTEFEILKASHRFLREEEEEERSLPWNDQVAKKYYSSLYREFAVCDLKHYKSGNFSLRWRTEDEVVSGAGETSCGNTRCLFHDTRQADQYHPSLSTLELPFSYVEDEESKFALVKVVLCAKCVKKLMYKRNKEKEAQQAARSGEQSGPPVKAEPEEVDLGNGKTKAEERGRSGPAIHGLVPPLEGAIARAEDGQVGSDVGMMGGFSLEDQLTQRRNNSSSTPRTPTFEGPRRANTADIPDSPAFPLRSSESSPHPGPSRRMTADASSSVPPSKASLKSWWNHFIFAQRAKKEAEENRGQSVVFGKPLKESLRYASVQISTANANGELYVWGYIPVVVAKCGLHLKETATEIEGTFRVNGSNKRMKDLQAAFEKPPRYGKSMDWRNEHYTTHDVASVFRRFLTQMPEPVIPHDKYFAFREPLARRNFNQDEVIATYKRLIRSLPRANQYLLLYVLDLLSVFARKADRNLMTAKNLAVIFRPALLSHPTHELNPQEHQLSQDVLEFLIAHQDWFMLDIPPPPTSASASTSTSARPPVNRSSRQRNAEGGDLSPVLETPPSRSGSISGATVTRRRTLPNNSRTNTIDAGSVQENGQQQQTTKLHKRQKRVSAQQPSSSSAGQASSASRTPHG
ncbi:hypothetical protein EIP91_005659 [Steccherinum ochraceum]|uniref:Rho-GAP domain-containing protein n=1 Tax=Steccherinum ochraceum TaxID=92696 RepID=A0A4R0R6W7_9APHY|nr:hypothetical protein EIP91_005659 [Steccherinum ochraceum]